MSPPNSVKSLMELIYEDIKATDPLNHRERHLVCLPVLGTGAGGLRACVPPASAAVLRLTRRRRRSTGDVVHQLLAVLHDFVQCRPLDVAVVTNEHPTYAALQSARARSRVKWPLRPKLLAEGQRLAMLAQAEELVAFVGAGISMGAGLPGWGPLLDDLALGAGMSEQDREYLDELSLVDKAKVIEQCVGGGWVGKRRRRFIHAPPPRHRT